MNDYFTDSYITLYTYDSCDNERNDYTRVDGFRENYCAVDAGTYGYAQMRCDDSIPLAEVVKVEYGCSIDYCDSCDGSQSVPTDTCSKGARIYCGKGNAGSAAGVLAALVAVAAVAVALL
eukprot:TRINITY_DN1958_c0_g4_i1.p1 TRINITY_DN1958_c0_g4~~TRINITY_DN1958_c0_g4_i1.p1  ORF type:complete len:120 (-),score=31.34 TRINITY_DN1958_c0_g4_i1:69-428(-)